jgi:NAD+ synthase (glutamine-hydrolysing)
MRLIRIGLVSVDTTVGAIGSNTKKAIDQAQKLDAAGCTVGVFPEQLFGGYPAEDMILMPEFIDKQWEALIRFAYETRECKTVFVVGLAVRSTDGLIYNASAVVCGGKIRGIVPKEHLPTYGVFYERRVFTAGQSGLYRELPSGLQIPYSVPFGDLVFEFPFGTLATCVCEDSWTPDGPLARRAIALVHAIPNASPARQGVVDTREQMLSTRSADHECVVAAAYQVGGNDSLVFDGGGYVFQNGQSIGSAARFTESIATFDVDLSRTERMRNQNTTWRMRQEAIQRSGETFRRVAVADGPGYLTGSVSKQFASRFSFLPTEEQARDRALEYMLEVAIGGLKGYFEKTKAFKKIIISTSGGKDSELTKMIAYLYAKRVTAHLPPDEQKKAIKEMILCVSQPTRFNSKETRDQARVSAEELGLDFIEESIEEEFELEMQKLRKMTGKEPDRKTRGNVMARIRGERMWNLSNMLQALWLQTGNMSEKAVGYTTVGGDHMGGYSLIGNIPKTVVSALLRYIMETYDIRSIEALLKQRASAELDEGQFDEDDLMPFPVLDLCYLLFVGELYSPIDMYMIMRARWDDDELARMHRSYTPGMLKDWIEKFLWLFRTSVFKWVTAPQAPHQGSLDLDRERALQIPVVTSGEWLEALIRIMRGCAG